MFRRAFRPALWALAIAVSSGSATAAGADFQQSSYIAVGRQTLVPYGWVDFCNRYRGECSDQNLPAMDLKLTARTRKILIRINSWVNGNVRSVSDADQWGVIDQWDFPSNGRGDCEDYVLFKRRLLIEEGFPQQALLVTVVKDEQGDGHAVLTVKTNQGEYVLDNLRDDIRPWSKTGYRFVKRQSQTSPNVWLDIGEPTSSPLMVSR